jgi:hypothetical protein
MAKKSPGDWKELMPALGLITLVLGVLTLTAMVKTDHDGEAHQRARDGIDRPARLTPSPPSSKKIAGTPLPSEKPGRTSTAPARKSGSLERRAKDDYRRLTGMPERWTSQLMLSCDPDNSLRHLKAVDWADDLYVIPAELKGQNCYRLCWGLYDSRSEAVKGQDIRSHLARSFPERQPKQLAEIRP